MPSPRQITWAKFRVLVVLAVATAVLVVVFYLLTGGTLLQAKATLYLYIPDASGLGPGSPVRVDGIDVGKVSSVKLSGSNRPNRIVQVALRVERSHLNHIPVDSTADIAADTLLGDEFIGIKSGSSPNHVAAGSEIALKPETNTLDLQQFAEALRTVDATLRGIEEGTTPLGQFVLGDDMYRNLLHRLMQIQAGMHALQDTTRQIGGLLYTDQVYRQIEGPLAALDQTLALIQSGQGPMGQLVRDSSQYDQLLAMFADVRHSAADLRTGALLQSDALYSQWNRSLMALIQTVDEMNANPLFSSSEVYDNLNGFAGQIRNTVHDFRENPKKFLRLKMF